MLLDRSILLQVCLLLTWRQCSCQSYDYGVEEGEGGSYNEEGDHPDYSKYFAADTSAPLVASAANNEGGFTSPIEFSGFFGPIEFGASQKQEITKPQNPFVKEESKVTGFVDPKQEFTSFYEGTNYPRDYFEQAQKLAESQQGDAAPQNYKLIPGPNYISHQVPAAKLEDETKNRPVKAKPKSAKNFDYEEKILANNKSPDYSYDFSPAPTGKFVDYTSGKSSSTVSQYPHALGHQQAKPATPSPYQKYSFQPVTDSYGLKSKYLESLISTIAPYNPTYSKVPSTAATPLFETQSSENVPKHLQGKNCKRVKKSIGGDEESDSDEHSRTKREAMDCFVCEDPGTSSKYTQCSYASESNPAGHYSEHSERFTIPAKETHSFRYKRYSGDYYDSDPYEFVKKQSQKAYDEPKEETKDYEEFKYVGDYYDETPSQKSYSEVQSEELKKNPGNCRKEEKDGMTCTVCKDSKTGGNYEQCSYAVEPKEQKYAYVTEKKYDSADEPTQGSESKAAPETKETEEPNKGSRDEVEEYQPKHDGVTTEKTVKFASKKFIQDEPYQIPDHFAEHTAQDTKSHLSELRGLDPALYGSPDSGEAEESESAPSTEQPVSPYKDLDDYHYKLFPQYDHQESKKSEVNEKSSETTRKDVEEVLAEFSKKDRSACKKAEKNGMTCYLCHDDKGIQHEECMYVSESKPQASHVAYHQVQQIKAPETVQKPQEQEPSAEASSESKRKRFFKKVTTVAPFTLEAAASEEIDTRIKYKKPIKNRRKGSKKSRDPKTSPSNRRSQKSAEDDEEPTQETPVEFTVGDEEGAFSAETKPVYSKRLGVKLPRYMVEKSEFEKEFDELSGSF